NSWREIVPPILWPAAIVAVVTALAVGVVALGQREPSPRALATLWAGTLMGIIFYFTARTFHVVDIRFFPFLQLGLCLTAAAGLGYLAGRLPAPEIWPVVGACAILPFVQSHVSFIPSWIAWNYSGFEKKVPWPTFRDVNAHLRGDFRDPRIFNVTQYIVRSQQAKEAVAKHPGLELEKRIGQYEIYRLKDNDGRYAVPLAVAPALVVTPDWKSAAYRWFKSARPGDPVPVF